MAQFLNIPPLFRISSVVEHLTVNQGVAGSKPASGVFPYFKPDAIVLRFVKKLGVRNEAKRLTSSQKKGRLVLFQHCHISSNILAR